MYDESPANMFVLAFQLLGGALGGIFFGKVFKKITLEPMWNAVAGIIGGSITGHFLGIHSSVIGMAAANNSLGLVSAMGSFVGGALGGMVCVALASSLYHLATK